MNGELAMKTEERHPISKITINSNQVKGLEDFAVDEKGEMTIKFRCLKPMGHGQTWDKEDLKKPLEGEYEILSGSASNAEEKTLKKIGKADSIRELDKAVEDE